MRLRWRIVLPLLSLMLSIAITYLSVRANGGLRDGSGRYFWWSPIRLDSDPLSRNEASNLRASPCPDGVKNCMVTEPIFISVHPGLITKFYMVAVFPALLATLLITFGLGRFGINEIVSFLIAMPLLTFAWTYLIGRILDWWTAKRQR
jgi:hypothetical protein